MISPISIRLFRVKCPSIAKRNNHDPISGVKSRTNPDIGPNGGRGEGGGGGTHVTMTGALQRFDYSTHVHVIKSTQVNKNILYEKVGGI